ncbi:MAG: sulfate/molybdate ABC transporter ATP-binding protein [Ilumatobacteraceae bacterium]
MTLSAQLELKLGSLDLDVALQVSSGEVLAILGPNGAGKSTILRAIAGLLALDAGVVAIDDERLDDPANNRFTPPERRPIGMVFQDYLLFEHMSVLDNVAFGPRARGVSKNLARSHAREWLERVGLIEMADQRPRALSGGQAQRVALARALVTMPRTLLLDEPLAALDAGTRAHLRRDLRGHLDTFSGTTLLVTHDPVDVHALADRVLVIEDGRRIQSGTLDDLAARPGSRYVADLIGLNLVVGDARDGVLVTERGTNVVISDPIVGPARAVIRPHSIVVTRQTPQLSSVRNIWPGTIVGIERIGDRARVRIDGPLPLTAEITTASLLELELQIGETVHSSVKATDIEVGPA